jgi:23S rRNA (cytidine1920-2'-O)/16S rRNA (cytidine1409-2'-O)-methyltransferase
MVKKAKALVVADTPRLDRHLAESGLSASREKAKREIASGWVKINGETVRDPARIVTGIEEIIVERPGGLYVSRGGEKLEKALSYFSIDVRGKTCVDLGASTGGFTDCLLRHGATKVFAVDVGYGQLDYSLRVDPRVVVMERQNARAITPAMFDRGVSFVSADLSFVSFVKVYDTISEVFDDISGVTLIKPQFEAEKSEHKKGVVTKESIHRDILTRTIESLRAKGLRVRGLTHSPIKGPKGNMEFLLYYGTRGDDGTVDIDAVVSEAHEVL